MLRERFDRRWVAIMCGLFVLYAVVRLALIAPDPSLTVSFSHDSGYISIVARNFAAGRGLVNDASWLMFLNPPRLPMVFHNSNPLYVLATAELLKLLHSDVTYAGCVVALFGNLLLGIGVLLLVLRFSSKKWLASATAASAMLFPSNFSESLCITSDELATGLVFCVAAAWVWAERPWHWAGVGVLFGLAWLTRSTATLVLPGLAIWLLLRKGLRQTVLAGVMVGVGAVVIASPWLYHTAVTRGSPFASDSGLYWLQDYFARVRHCTVEQYWRSLVQPPGAGEVMRRDAAGLVKLTLEGLPRTLYYWCAGVAGWNKIWFVLLSAAVGMGAWLCRAWLRTAESAAVAVILLANVLAVAVRGESTEVRFYGPVNTLLAILIAVPLFSRPRWMAAPAAVCFAFAMASMNVSALQRARTVVAAQASYREMARELSSTLPQGDAVVTNLPYWFTYYTGRPSVSPPYPGKRELLDVMNHYRASVVPLPSGNLTYFYAGAPSSLAPELEPAGHTGSYVLLRKPVSP
jgi:hypothetical protein